MAGVAAGLDFAAILTIADAQGADVALLADALPEIESVMIAGMNGDVEQEE